jgi:hypothetical protein
VTPVLLLVVFCVVGLLVYVLAANPKASEVGRLMFACALLALCLDLGHVLAVLR